MELTLLVLAAGMGSRYGSLKQMDPMGPHGETVLDYSVYDAIRAGFTRVVFVIREDFAEAFNQGVCSRFQDKIKVDCVYQTLDDLPEGYSLPEGRTKPWGTSHAIRAARHTIKGPFAVINADDFYGADSYQQIAQYFRSQETPSSADTIDATDIPHYCMVGYHLANTLSDHGDVNRGICADQSENLTSVSEVTQIARQENGQVWGTNTEGQPCQVQEDAIVSMNFWGFTHGFFDHLEDHFLDFMQTQGQEMTSESYIPTAVDQLISTDKAHCKILKTDSSWFGVTYPDDKAIVVANIQKLIESGVYPTPLH